MPSRWRNLPAGYKWRQVRPLGWLILEGPAEIVGTLQRYGRGKAWRDANTGEVFPFQDAAQSHIERLIK